MIRNMKQRVYIETSIVSYLTARPSRDIVVAAHQELTRQWWEGCSSRFELVISELVEQEAGKGDPDAAAARITALRGALVLSISDAAVALGERLVSDGPISRESAADALHISVAAVNGCDYLLTWNCTHIANAAHRSSIEALVEDSGYGCPVICTPEELMES